MYLLCSYFTRHIYQCILCRLRFIHSFIHSVCHVMSCDVIIVTSCCMMSCDVLSADTLYKVSLVSDEDATSSTATPPESPSKQARNGKGSFTSWGTSLLRGGKKDPSPSPATTLMSASGPVKSAANSLEESPSGKSNGNSPTNSEGEKKEVVSGLNSEQTAEAREKAVEEFKPAEPKRQRSSNPLEHQIALVVSTLGECSRIMLCLILHLLSDMVRASVQRR